MAVAIVVAVVLATAVWRLVVQEADRRMNRVSLQPPYEVEVQAQELHERLFVVDMHSDFLLWRRRLSARYERGHMDLPRLVEANVGLQVFSVVTKSPWGQNYDRNQSDTDRITLLAVAQAWPPKSWNSLLERALFQARRLRSMEENGELTVIRTAADLEGFRRHRSTHQDAVAGLLAVEGLHALEGRLDHVDTLFDAGFRMMAPVHMFDNEVAGSAHGTEQSGLTPLGRDVIRRMESLGVIVDLAHASEATIDDVLAMATRPVVVSHTGVRGTCDSPRNLSDEQIRAVAATGGVIGIGFWDRAVCGTSVDDVARAIRYTANLVGIDHVGLGSDFDGTVVTAFDVTGLPLLTAALIGHNFNDREIAKIMGTNVLRVMNDVLPDHQTEGISGSGGARHSTSER